MSLHDALVYVVTEHLKKLLKNEILVQSVLILLDTDDKLFWYLGNQRKANRIISSYVGSDTICKGELLKLKTELEKNWE